MKQIKYLIFILIILLTNINVNAEKLNISSKSAILYNKNENKIIYKKNENEVMPIASLTKIMTAIIAIENKPDLSETVILNQNDFKNIIEEKLVTAGFKINDKITYEDLLYATLLPSGADAALALANHTFNSKEEFIKKMNEKAHKLGLRNTHFSNAIGIDEKENYSTAKDIAKLFNYALNNKKFKKIIQTNNYTTTNGINIHNKIRHNKQVGNYLLGGKTGTTDGAGLCLASIANKNNINYMLVTLNAPYDKKGPHNYEDAKTIYEYFINNYNYQKIFTKEDIILTLKTKNTKEKKVEFHPKETIKYYLPNNYNKKDIKIKYKGLIKLNYNTKKGKKIGTLSIYYKNKNIKTMPIIMNQKLHFSITEYIKNHKLLDTIIIGFITIIIVRRINVKKHRNVQKFHKNNARKRR